MLQDYSVWRGHPASQKQAQDRVQLGLERYLFMAHSRLPVYTEKGNPKSDVIGPQGSCLWASTATSQAISPLCKKFLARTLSHYEHFATCHSPFVSPEFIIELLVSESIDFLYWCFTMHILYTRSSCIYPCYAIVGLLCMDLWTFEPYKMASRMKPYSVSETGLKHIVRLRSWEKAMAGALLSIIYCCFVWKLPGKSHPIIWTSPSEVEKEERKTFWPSGDFLIWYFCDAFSHHWYRCST